MTTDNQTKSKQKPQYPPFWYAEENTHAPEHQHDAADVLARRRAALEALRKLQQIDRRYTGTDIALNT